MTVLELSRNDLRTRLTKCHRELEDERVSKSTEEGDMRHQYNILHIQTASSPSSSSSSSPLAPHSVPFSSPFYSMTRQMFDAEGVVVAKP